MAASLSAHALPVLTSTATRHAMALCHGALGTAAYAGYHGIALAALWCTTACYSIHISLHCSALCVHLEAATPYRPGGATGSMPSRTLAMHRRIVQGQIQNLCVPLHLQQANMQRKHALHMQPMPLRTPTGGVGACLALRLLQCRLAWSSTLVGVPLTLRAACVSVIAPVELHEPCPACVFCSEEQP